MTLSSRFMIGEMKGDEKAGGEVGYHAQHKLY